MLWRASRAAIEGRGSRDVQGEVPIVVCPVCGLRVRVEERAYDATQRVAETTLSCSFGSSVQPRPCSSNSHQHESSRSVNTKSPMGRDPENRRIGRRTRANAATSDRSVGPSPRDARAESGC